MRHKLVRNDVWVLWVMYGLGIVITCFSIVAVCLRGFPDVPAERFQIIIAVAFGPAFLGSLLLAHLDYWLERRRKRNVPKV